MKILKTMLSVTGVLSSVFSSTIYAANIDPIAVADHITAVQGQTVQFSVKHLLSNDFDEDGDRLYLTTVDDSVNGLVQINRDTGILTFTPTDFNTAQGRFTYGLADEANSSNYSRMGFANVDITFLPAQDVSGEQPAAIADHFVVQANETITLSASDILANDVNPSGKSLNLLYIDDWSGGNITLQLDKGQLHFSANSDFSQGQFTYGIAQAGDENNYEAWGYGTVTLSTQPLSGSPVETAGIGAAPIANNDTLQLNSEQNVVKISLSSLLQNDYDPESQAIYLVYVDDGINGHVSLDADSGSIEFLLDENATNGGFTYGISDSSTVNDFSRMGYAQVRFSLTDSNQNQKPPIAINDNFSTEQNLPITINLAQLYANDENTSGSTIYLSHIDDWSNGFASYEASTQGITFTPNNNFTGQAQFYYIISDLADDAQFERTSQARVDITVLASGEAAETTTSTETETDTTATTATDTQAPDNQSPRANEDQYELSQNQVLSINISDLLANDSDAENDVLRLIAIDDWLNGQATVVSGLNTGSGEISFTPTPDFVGEAQFYYIVTDLNQNTNSQAQFDHRSFAKVTINITSAEGSNPINQPVIANNDSVEGIENEVLEISLDSLFSNDIGPENQALFLSMLGSSDHGQMALSSDGNRILFTPNSDFIGDTHFNYYVSDIDNDDSLERASVAQVNVTIAANNSAPSRDINLSCNAPLPQIELGQAGLIRAFENLPPFFAAVSMVQARNNSDFWFIATRAGQIYQIDNDSNTSELRLVLDLADTIVTDGEFGLTSIAIHPNYPEDNRLFAFFNDNPTNHETEGRSVIASYLINTNDLTVDASSKQEILTLVQPVNVHNGGDMAFGLDGMLIAAFGDSEHQQQSQNLSQLLGSVIRIDVNTTPYSIPSDNPYYQANLPHCNSQDHNRTSNCPEIYAKGFRNPWRLSVDQVTGDIWIGDVGDESFEEVDRVIAGGNYGWPIMEGAHCMNEGCDQSGLILPVAEYGRELGQSIAGGYVYRGSQSPSLTGQYIFSDIFSGQFFTVASEMQTTITVQPTFRSIAAFGMAQGNDGEVYAINAFPEGNGDNIYRISAGGGASITMPERLSETGCFDTATKLSSTGVVDYNVNSALWTDGEAKLRSFSLPNDATIEVLNDGDYRFPTGSILIKHFLHQDNFLETRLLINHSTGWQGYSYEWNEQQTDALLLEQGKTVSVDGHQHVFPSQSQCGSCHTGSANISLGIEHKQLNHEDATSGINVIDNLSNLGYFSSPQEGENQARLFALDDDNASVDDRVRSYLHSNCSSCHRPGASFGDIDLRFSTPLADTKLCNVAPTKGTLGITNAMRIVAGSAERSVLYARLKTLEPSTRMPPLARLIEDQAATDLLATWINNMQSCN